MLLGDMLVVGKPPAKFVKALASIAGVLHPAFDTILPKAGKSKESCVLCSLTVRDFLWKAGFKDAKVTTVYLAIRATDPAGVEVHSAGCGDHNGPIPVMVPIPKDTAARWNGHMVVEVPSAGYVVDTTLFHMKRPAWPVLPGMIAVPTEHDAVPSYGLAQLAGAVATMPDGNTLRMWWLRQENPRWRGAPDTERGARAPVVKALVQSWGDFGSWRG